MKKIYFIFLLLTLYGTTGMASREDLSWKAGVAKENITPSSELWMAGYAARTAPAQGKQHELWIKAVVLEDENGNEGVWVTSDILGFPKALSDRVKNRLYQEFGWSRAQVILSSSHTHSGPVLEEALFDIYPLNQAQIKAVSEYTQNLESKLIQVVKNAKASKVPVRVSTGQGVSRFQVNRRNNPEGSWHEQAQLNGPMDHAVPVIKIENEGGLMAVLFGYACHPTDMDQ